MREEISHNVIISPKNKEYKITQCTVYEEDIPVAVGIAICSPKDQYNRKRGNMIARGRVHKALINTETSCFVTGRLAKETGIVSLSQYIG